MPAHDYSFLTHWRFAGDCDEVYDVLSDAGGLARWWPSVYLDVRVLHAGRADGVGREVELLTKGWLPYTLRWRFRIVEADRPRGFAIEALGDFDGSGRWTLRQDGPYVDVRYDWRVRAEKPLLRRLSFVLRPLFAANHRWAMARGERSLQLELRRRRAVTAHERSIVPEPPGPTFYARRSPAA